MIEQLYPAGMRSEIICKPSTSLPDYIYYYCPQSAHLFLLSCHGFLIDFDIDATKVHATFEIQQLCSGGMSPKHMVVIGDNLFVVVFGSTGAEVRYTRLSDPMRVIVAHSLPSVDDSSEILSLNPISASPLEVSVWLNTRGDIFVCILRMIRQESPILFAEMGFSSHPGTGTLPKTALVAGSGVHRIPGKDGGYCLRNNKGKLLFRSPDKTNPPESFNYHLTVVSHTPIILRVHYETIEGFVMTTLQRSLLSFAYTPKTGSTFCRYGSDDSFKLWDCKVRSRPPEDDEATDGSGKIYYVFGKRVEVDNNVYKQSTRLIRAYTYLKNE
ncbi:hypothetical protein FOL47_010691 [Perkinsus chesapeaki]|uniref:Uncharacterized protein n=1 Tax=Perkinsus chesapeaki TaxID=330153 RepID=A0A7J6MQ43_PERCH|nr:hypothetical protein FOL47_010691 [Perkinsus chesapeaki]